MVLIMKKTVKKLRLRKWVKDLLKDLLEFIVIILIGLGLGLVILKGLENFNKYAKICDNEKGYTCSYYQVRQTIIKHKNIERKMQKVWDD